MRLDGNAGHLAASARLQAGAGGGTSAGDLAAAKDALAAGRSGELDAEEVGEQFEQLFATMLVRELRKGAEGLSKDGGLFGKSAGSDVYSGWFDEHVANTLAERDTLGMVGMIKAGVARLQAAEAVGATPATEVRP